MIPYGHKELSGLKTSTIEKFLCSKSEETVAVIISIKMFENFRVVFLELGHVFAVHMWNLK